MFVYAAVPEQTAVDGEIPWFQISLEDTVGDHKEILVLHDRLLSSKIFELIQSSASRLSKNM